MYQRKETTKNRNKMQYFRVKDEHDGKATTKRSSIPFVYGGELFTEYELKMYGVRRCYVEPIEVNPLQTRTVNGARFEI